MQRKLLKKILFGILCIYFSINIVYAEIYPPILYEEQRYYNDIFSNSLNNSSSLYYKLNYLFKEVNYLDTLTNEISNLFFSLFKFQKKDFDSIINNKINYIKDINYTNENYKNIFRSNPTIYNGFNLDYILVLDIYTDIYKNNLKSIIQNFNTTQQKQLQVLIYNFKLNQLVSEQILKDFSSVEYDISDRERLILFIAFKNSIKIHKTLAEHISNNLSKLAQENNIKYFYPTKWINEPKNLSNIDLPDKDIPSIVKITEDRTYNLRNEIIMDVINNSKKYSNKYIASIYFDIAYECTIKTKEYEKAFEYITKAINYDPKNSSYWFNRGILNGLYLKHINEALYDFNKSIELNPNNAEYYYFRAYVLVIASRYSEALNDYKKVILLAPDNIEAKQYIRLLKENQGAIVKAKLMSKNIFYWNNIGGAEFEILLQNPYLLLK